MRRQVDTLTSLDELAKTPHYRYRVHAWPHGTPTAALSHNMNPPPQPSSERSPLPLDSSTWDDAHGPAGPGPRGGGDVARMRTSWLSTVAGITPFLVQSPLMAVGAVGTVGVVDAATPGIAGGVHDVAHSHHSLPRSSLLATAELRRWVRAWVMAVPPRVVAVRVPGRRVSKRVCVCVCVSRCVCV